MPRRRARNSLVGWLCCLLLAASAAVTVAEEAVEAPTELQVDRQEILRQIFGEEELFLYRTDRRRDPFMPFLKEKTVEQELRTEEEIPAEELTGLRRFEPGQLTLVAIVLGTDGPLAMVQDPVGKGYIVREGTPIGRYGVVEKITTGRVIVKQRTASTWTREKLFKRVEMVLPKEGEK